MSSNTAHNPILQPPRPFIHGQEGLSWRWLHVAVGREMFGRPAGPWGILFAPLPLAAAVVGCLALCTPATWLDPWLRSRMGELAWLALVPFVLPSAAQSLAMTASELLWRRSEGQRHIDYSPRRWHYHVAMAMAALPLVLLQCSDAALDLYLRVGLAFTAAFGSMKVPVVGYTPGFAHLLALAVLPLVHHQVGRVLIKIPGGRLQGLHRELARLRGALQWQPEVWVQQVGESFDHWLADIAPPEAPTGPTSERQRQHRLRWLGLRKELVASWSDEEAPPDLARANRALHLYREGW